MPNPPTRRQVLGGLLGAAVPHVLRSQTPGKPPNVVFIMCDHMRGDAMTFAGSPCARTPNLDRLARNGVSFENHFSNNPVCQPSRKSIFSGRYPHEHGTLTNSDGNLLSMPDTMIDYFKQRGYRTGYIGKNDAYLSKELTSADTARIRDREPFREYNRFVTPEWHSDTYWPAEECYAWLNTADALEFIDCARDRNPFFLTVSYFDPHPPYMAPSEYTSKYYSYQMKIPPFVHPSALSGRLEDYWRALKYDRIKDADLTETMRYYYAAIEGMVDYQVGRIMTALSNRGLLENTIVAFTADHGDFMGQHRMVRKGMFLYDGLLRVPMIWKAPGVVGGRRSKVLGQGIDIFPTLIELTGGTARPDLPGRSLKKAMTGTPDPAGRTIFTSAGYAELPREIVENRRPASADPNTPLHTLVEETTFKSTNRYSMARTQEWKLILSESRPTELYRMNGGWVERQNVAERPEYGSVRRDLEQRLHAFWRW